MSAPARRIDSSDSSSTRGSSSQPRAAGGLHHRVLARDVVGGDRHAETLLHAPDDVEVRERRLHHHDVGAFLRSAATSRSASSALAGSIWYAAAISEAGRRARRLAERAIEARRVLRRVRDDDDVGAPGAIERGPDRADAAVHHVRGRDDIRAGPRVRQRRRRQAQAAPRRCPPRRAHRGAVAIGPQCP